MTRTTYERELTDEQRAAFAAGLRREREKQGITLRDLGALAFVHYTKLSKIETGKRLVTNHREAGYIANALGVDVWRMLR
jgi:transcriptional regulator with XRE-family HTH domain